jgi:hypothetical protein
LRRKFVFILISILLVACSGGGTGTATAVSPTSTTSPTATPDLPPSPLTILVLPADMPRAESDQYQTLVYNLAQQSGMRFQVRNVLSSSDLEMEGEALKVVVAFPPDPGLAELAAAAPQVQFLAVGIPGLSAAANLSSVGAAGLPADQQAFLAGYIAGLTAPEWKVGALYQKDTPGGEAARDAFINGFVFYCGSCRNPYFPQPAGIYPILVGIPSDAPESDYNGHADLLIHNVVKVAYVYPQVATPELLTYMAQKGLLLISQAMPGENLRSNWIASIQPDLVAAIERLFPDMVAGRGGQVAPTPLFLTEVNPDLLSEAKLRLAQEVLDGLQNGTIGTGVNP